MSIVDSVEVDGLCCESGVQGAGFAVGIGASPIVDAVGGDRSLLHLGNEVARPDVVNLAGRQGEYVAGMGLMLCQMPGDGAVGSSFSELSGTDGLLESVNHGGVGFSINHIPHFGLAVGLAMAQSHLVGGMHLNGQVAGGVNELDQ